MNSFTAIDGAGLSAACSFSVTVSDNEAPVISDCGGDQILAGNANCQAMLPDLTGNISFDNNCPGLTITQSPVAGMVIMGSTSVSFTLTDGSGNSSGCSINVSIEDNTAPVLNCPASVTVGTTAGTCTGIATFAPTATDNCDNNVAIMQTGGPASGSVFSLGATPVSFSATDDAGNVSNCDFDVVVSDDDAPTITVCPPDISLSTDANCEAITADYTALVAANDNCDPDVTITQSPAPGTVSGGFLTIVMTATDGTGNASSCSFQTTAEDMTAPTITCPATQSFNADDDCQTPLPDFTGLATATDNCGGFTVTQSPLAGNWSVLVKHL
ncbi:MAG: HYR domain-containing protein [Lewinellaceae bacterium]|nr:HYR domain-containing protein [Lewinellaceae bacterium]